MIITTEPSSPLGITGFDHLTLAVSDLDASAVKLMQLGFTRVGTAENLERKVSSVLLSQGTLAIVLVKSQISTDPVSQFVTKHGDGVYDVAFRVSDTFAATDTASAKGVEVLSLPKAIRRNDSFVDQSSIKSPCEVRHSLLNRSGEIFLEGFENLPRQEDSLLQDLLFCRFVVGAEELSNWIQFYSLILGGPPAMQSEKAAAFRLPGSAERFLFIQTPREENKFLEVNHGAGVISFGVHVRKWSALCDDVDRLGIQATSRLPNYLCTQPIIGSVSVEALSEPDARFAWDTCLRR